MLCSVMTVFNLSRNPNNFTSPPIKYFDRVSDPYRARKEFYHHHWMGRYLSKTTLRHGATEKPYVRKGKFKLASSLNNCINLSRLFEEKLASLQGDDDDMDSGQVNALH